MGDFDMMNFLPRQGGPKSLMIIENKIERL